MSSEFRVKQKDISLVTKHLLSTITHQLLLGKPGECWNGKQTFPHFRQLFPCSQKLEFHGVTMIFWCWSCCLPHRSEQGFALLWGNTRLVWKKREKILAVTPAQLRNPISSRPPIILHASSFLCQKFTSTGTAAVIQLKPESCWIKRGGYGVLVSLETCWSPRFQCGVAAGHHNSALTPLYTINYSVSSMLISQSWMQCSWVKQLQVQALRRLFCPQNIVQILIALCRWGKATVFLI